MLEEERTQVIDLIIKYPLNESLAMQAVHRLLADGVPFHEIIVWLRLQGELKTAGISV